ncbi:MAG: DUF2058 family protein [Myxococcales bacterium]|nr:DUF2058 family protein [Myxococcales bacterium]
MLDLKAQLAAAGLVSDEEIKAAEARERNKAKSKGKRRSKRKAPGKAKAGLDRGALEAAGKGERYTMVRQAVKAQRLDSSGPIPAADAVPFHFAGDGGVVGRVFVSPPAQRRLEEGSAAILAFISDHGLAHAVVPAALAREVAAVIPEWLRLLRGVTDATDADEATDASPADGEGEAAGA